MSVRHPVIGLAERCELMDIGLLILLVELNFESLSSDFEAIHLFDGILRGFGIIKADEADSFGFSVLFSHDPGGEDAAENLEEVVEF